MLINPKLIKAVNKARKELLDYKKTPAGKNEITKVDFAKIGKERTAYFKSLPKELQFGAQRGSQLDLLKRRYNKILDTVKLQKKMEDK